MRRLEGRIFPDRREPEGVLIDAADAMTLLSTRSAASVLMALRAIDWRHPALFVYREAEDDRWSYVTLGLSSPELGEGDG